MISSTPFRRSSARTSAIRLNSTNWSCFTSSEASSGSTSRSISSPSASNCASTADSNISGAVRKMYANCCPRGDSGTLGAFNPIPGFSIPSSASRARALARPRATRGAEREMGTTRVDARETRVTTTTRAHDDDMTIRPNEPTSSASAGEGVARTRVTRWGQNLSMVSRKCTTSMTSAGIRDVARARAPRDRFERSCER